MDPLELRLKNISEPRLKDVFEAAADKFGWRSRKAAPGRGFGIENGRIINPRFSQYRVPRFPDIPQIETVILARKDLPPAGAGGTPIFGLAPATGNAIFAAAGIRLHKLPLAPDGLPRRSNNA